jgi:hypothetical protein
MRFITCSPDGTAPSFAGSKLCLPSITIGNVGQLAVDLLINSLVAPRVGFLEDADLLPCAGRDPYPHAPGLAAPAEVYQHGTGDASLVFVQQRSPAAPGTQRRFSKALAAWVREAGFRDVLILASLDSTYRRGMQLDGLQLRHFTAPGGQSLELPGVPEVREETRFLPTCTCAGLFRVQLQRCTDTTRLAGVVAALVRKDAMASAHRLLANAHPVHGALLPPAVGGRLVC